MTNEEQSNKGNREGGESRLDSAVQVFNSESQTRGALKSLQDIRLRETQSR